MSFALILLVATAAEPQNFPPPTPKHDVVEQIHSHPVADPYRWLERLDDPDVGQWAQKQQRYTDGVLEPFSDTIQAKPNALTQKEISVDAGRMRRLPSGALLFLARMAGDSVDALYRRSANGKLSRVFGPSPDPSGTVRTIAFFEPAPNEQWVALAIGENGKENNALYVLDGRTGKLVDGPIPGVRFAAISWWPDSRRFVYPRLRESASGPEPALYQGQQVYAHTIGTSWRQDALVFGSALQASSQVPESDFPVVEIRAEAGLAFARHSDGVAQEFGLYVAPLQSLERAKVPWRKVVAASAGYGMPRASGSASLIYSAGQLYLMQMAGKRGIHQLNLTHPQHAKVHFADPESVVIGQAQAADGVYVQVQNGMRHQLLHFGLGSKTHANVPLPFDGQFDLVKAEAQSQGVIVRDRQWTTRARYWQVQNGVAKALSIVPVPADGIALSTREVFIDSADGMRVPLSIVHAKERQSTQAIPFLLTGYAAYGITMRPSFNDNLVPLYRAGMGYAVCHARGGGELGEDWHRAAMKSSKSRSWEDFIACAQWLIEHGYTRSDRLIAEGASAGAIMVGRAMTERPELFAGVHLAFGSLNPMRAQSHANGAPNIAEFGNLNDPDEARWLFGMDTYQHVQAGVPYPAVLLTHGWNDARTPFWMSAKTAARLQAASTSGKPVLMNIDFAGGHQLLAGSQSQVLAAQRAIHAFFRLVLRDAPDDTKTRLATPAQ